MCVRPTLFQIYLHRQHLDVSSFSRHVKWISWFHSPKGNEYFREVDEDFIIDRFNLTGLNNEVQTLDLITDNLGSFVLFACIFYVSTLIIDRDGWIRTMRSRTNCVGHSMCKPDFITVSFTQDGL
jgi:hypothetical protein